MIKFVNFFLNCTYWQFKDFIHSPFESSIFKSLYFKISKFTIDFNLKGKSPKFGQGVRT